MQGVLSFFFKPIVINGRQKDVLAIPLQSRHLGKNKQTFILMFLQTLSCKILFDQQFAVTHSSPTEMKGRTLLDLIELHRLKKGMHESPTNSRR